VTLERIDVWKYHLRPWSGLTVFPRAVAFPSRTYLLSWSMYFKVAEVWVDRGLFVGVYSEPQVESKMFDTIFLDIDSYDGLRSSYSVMRKVVSALENEGIEPRVYFSGRKGFHVWIDFPPAHVYNFKLACRRLVRFLLGKELYGALDSVILGIVRQVSRVPFTRHVESGLYCIPVDPEWVLKEILTFASKPNELPKEVLRYKVSREVKKMLEEDRYFYFTVTYDSAPRCTFPREEPSKEPPCITMYMDMLEKTGELPHWARLQLAIYLLRRGWTYDDIVNVFRKARDFNRRKTEYQVRYADKKGLNMLRCSRVMELGLCPGRCEYYPSLNLYFPRLKGGENEGVRGNGSKRRGGG